MPKDDPRQQLITFCQIQLAIVAERQERLRKDLLDCKIQNEFLTEILSVLTEEVEVDS